MPHARSAIAARALLSRYYYHLSRSSLQQAVQPIITRRPTASAGPVTDQYDIWRRSMPSMAMMHALRYSYIPRLPDYTQSHRDQAAAAPSVCRAPRVMASSSSSARRRHHHRRRRSSGHISRRSRLSAARSRLKSQEDGRMAPCHCGRPRRLPARRPSASRRHGRPAPRCHAGASAEVRVRRGCRCRHGDGRRFGARARVTRRVMRGRWLGAARL